MPAAGAASVAAELLAFYREPVVHRPRYLQGQQPLPAGHVVLRFALGRFPHGWARDLRPQDREEVRTAAQTFVRQVCLWERATHYQLLCVAPGADREAIRENYHLLIALIHPDRQEVASPTWPTGCAQRANQAYQTLSDARSRAAYDAGLQKPAEPVGFEARAHESASRGARSRHARAAMGAASLAKRAVIVAGVIATLFVVQSWWVGGLKPEHSLLERAVPSSLRWGGATLPDSPRFLGANASAIEPGPELEPLEQPKRLAALASWVPALTDARPPIPVTRPPAAPAQPPAPEPAPMAVAAPRALAAPAPMEAASVPAAKAPAAAQPPAEPPLRLAQAGGAPKAAVDLPSREQVEGVVALMVGFYDSGDSERLVGLVDPDSLGWWQGYRTRTAFAEFFGATRTRRLRMERLTWSHNGTVAEARGEATVVAEYADGRPRLERRVPVEVDIALRAGTPRITRLVLFPNA